MRRLLWPWRLPSHLLEVATWSPQLWTRCPAFRGRNGITRGHVNTKICSSQLSRLIPRINCCSRDLSESIRWPFKSLFVTSDCLASLWSQAALLRWPILKGSMLCKWLDFKTESLIASCTEWDYTESHCVFCILALKILIQTPKSCIRNYPVKCQI